MTNKPCVYKITNISNLKFYIGSTVNFAKRMEDHFDNLRNNKHINIYFQRAFNKYGEQSFKFEVIAECDTEVEARELEEIIIRETYDINYNIAKVTSGGDLISYHPNRDEIVSKIKHSLFIRYENMSEEERKRLSDIKKGEQNGMFGKTHSEEVKSVLSQKAKKRYETPENNPFYGKQHKEETRKLFSNIAKERVGEKNPFFGKHHTDETKAKISAVHKGKKNESQSRKVKIDDIVYESVSFAARSLGVVPATIINRIRSKNDLYKNYQYCD